MGHTRSPGQTIKAARRHRGRLADGDGASDVIFGRDTCARKTTNKALTQTVEACV